MSIALGAFDLLELVGRGGMGEVWRGVHRAEGLPVAIKIVRADLAHDERLRALFRREVRAAGTLDHPNIVLLFDQGEIDGETAARSEGQLIEGAPFLVMEWASGGTLGRLAPMRWPELVPMLMTLLGALGHAHARGIVHRDLKLTNVLVSTDWDLRPGPKLADFGIALLRAERGEDATVVGTRGYMAPEQAADLWRDEGPWTDLYALGVLAWKLATRTSPPPALLTHDHAPDSFEAWVRALMEPDPGLRVRRAADAIAMLSRVRPSAAPIGAEVLVPEPETEAADVEPTMSASKPASLRTESGYVPLPLPARVSTAEGVAAPRAQRIPDDWRGASPPMSAHLRFSGAGMGLLGVRSIPIVDREPERDELWSAFRREGPRAIVIAGAAGAGKTRLGQWLGERAHELGAATVLSAHGDGIAPMLARHLGCEDLDAESAEWRLRGLFELADEDGEAAPTATWLLAPERIARAERLAIATRLLGRLARERPLIVRLDDPAEEALALVAHVLRTAIEVLFVITVRDEALVDRPIERVLVAEHPRIELGPLPPEHRARFLRDLLGLSVELAARVEERTAGNPAFAAELVRGWVRAGALEASADGFRLRDPASIALPSELAAIWREAIAGVPGEAIEIAAVLGHDVDHDEWSRACEAHGIVATGLDALLDRGLAKSTARGFSFAHGMVREALLERGSERAALYHRACAAATTGERRARHLLAAGDAAAAIAPILEAAEARLGGGEAGRAEALLLDLDRALDPAIDRGPIIVLLAEAHRQRAQYDEAEALAAKAQQLGDPSVVARAFAMRGAIARERGHVDEMARWYEMALERAEAAGDARFTASCARWIGIAHVDRGDARAAIAWLERALDAGDDLLSARVHVTLAVASRMLGDLGAARVHLEQALDGMKRAGARGGLADVLNALGELARASGDPARAADFYRRAAALHESLGSRSEAVARMNLGLALIEDARPDEARSVLLASLHTLTRQGRQGLAALAHVALLACAAHARDWEAWDRHAAQAEELLLASGFADVDVAAAADHAALAAEEDPARADVARRIANAQRRALARR